MILHDMKSLYLVYTETECYFTPYVSHYKWGQYIVLKNVPYERYVIERGEFIFRIDDVFDKIEDLIQEATRSECHTFCDLKNVLGFEAHIVIGPGGTIKKASTDNTMCAVIQIPFNSKRLKYGKVHHGGNIIRIRPCKADGTEGPYPTHTCGYSDSCNKVYHRIVQNPNVSTEDLIWILGMPANRVTPRLTELYKAGRIDISETFINPHSGRKMSRWIAKD